MCGGVATLRSEIVSTLPANFTFPVAFVDLGSSWKKQKNSYCAFADWLEFWVSGFSQQDGRKVYWTWYIANLNSRTKGDCAIRPPHCWLQRNMCVGNWVWLVDEWVESLKKYTNRPKNTTSPQQTICFRVLCFISVCAISGLRFPPR